MNNNEKDNKLNSTVRVDINRLDKLMNMVGELLINKTRLQALDISLNKFHDTLPQLDRVTMELHYIVMQIRHLLELILFLHNIKNDINFIMKG